MRLWTRIQLHFIADPDLIQILFKVTGIGDHWSIDPPGLHFERLSLHYERPRPSSSILNLQKLLNFDFCADPDPVLILMRIRIRLSKIMRIHAYPDQQPCL
jgi:hypothetical protein